MTQDRFEFRAWHKTKNHMFDVLGLSFYDGTVTESYADSWNDGFSPSIEYRLSDVILMQCTGRKDKHGQLVFESDILKNGEGNVAVVKFDEDIDTDRHWQIAIGFFIDFERGYPDGVFEKIGNIYENPELVKE